MSNGRELVEVLSSTVKSLYVRKIELEKRQSECDALEQRILHYIELGNMDAVAGAKVLKKLRQVRNERRQIKEEHALLHSVTDRLNKSNMLSYKVPIRPIMVCQDTLETILK